MRPTRLRDLLGLALAAAAVALVVLRVGYASLPRLPGAAPVSLALLVIGNGYLALTVRDRHTRRLRVAPLAAARYVALAKASEVLGALLAGAYAAVVLRVVGELRLRDPSHDARVAGVGVALGVLLVVAALRLERQCRLPPPPDESPDVAER